MTLNVHVTAVPGAELPPVVLLHGFASSGREDYVTTGWADSLAAVGRTAIVVDLPAHGANAPVLKKAQATTDGVVAAIIEAIDTAVPGQCRAASFDVIGYSLGARLAWELPAATNGRVRRLVLGGISPFEPFAAVDLAELAAAIAGEAEPSNPITGMMAAMIQAPGCDAASLATLIGGLASQPFDPAATTPDVPTMFIAGQDDPMSQGVEALAEAIPNAALEHVPGDHRGALDSAELRAAAITFLA